MNEEMNSVENQDTGKFVGVAEEAGVNWVIFSDENYVEGSSSEHAAFEYDLN